MVACKSDARNDSQTIFVQNSDTLLFQFSVFFAFHVEHQCVMNPSVDVLSGGPSYQGSNPQSTAVVSSLV